MSIQGSTVRHSRGTSPRHRPSRTRQADAVWIPPGGRIVVAGHAIVGGMVYMGTHLLSENRRGTEPSLVDPTLPVEWQEPHWSSQGFNYYPAYDAITDTQRAAYLIWLDRGRRDREIPIAYAFMFLYGLERRLFADLWNRPEHRDFSPILAEVEALHQLYGPSNRSFRRYSSSLLDFMEALHPGACPNSLSLDGVGGVPYSLLRRMGEAAVAGDRIAPEVALRYVRTHPDSQLGVAADRAYVEFDELFLSRYRERYGEGMALRPPRSDLVVSYQPSSEGLVRRTVTLNGVPDVKAGGAALHYVKSLSSECSSDLDAYSRFLGRNPNAGESPEAVALLPIERIKVRWPEAVTAVQSWAEEVLSDGSLAVTPTAELLRSWTPVDGAKKSHLAALARLLSEVDIGMEPDVRYGATGDENCVVLFRHPDGGTAPDAQVGETRVLLDLLAPIAVAGDGISDSGRGFVREHLKRRFKLSEAGLVRSDAALMWSCAAPGKRSKRRGSGHRPNERDLDLQLLVGFALHNGEVTPLVIDALVKACGACGIDEGEVYRRLHSLPLEDSGLVLARGPSGAIEYAIDAPSDPDENAGDAPSDLDGHKPLAVALDPKKLERRLADTEHVYELLGEVFSETDVQEEPAAAQAAQRGTTVATLATNGEHPLTDLDNAHRELAVLLARQPEWAFTEAEEAAESVGLPLLSGAIDTINEVVIDICGEPLVEGDDPVTLNEYAVAEVLD